MISVFYVHWDEEEARERVASLQARRFAVRAHWKADEIPRFRSASWPDAFVISLDRLPEQGRSLAEWVWSAKARQSIPIVFSGGAPDQVKAARALFPGAHYCHSREESRVLERLFR